MKTFFIFSILISLCFTDKSPRFKFLDKNVSLYVSVKGLPKNTDDPISTFIKDSLRQAGFKIISFEENVENSKQFARGVMINSKMFHPANFKTSEDYFEKLYGNLAPLQTLTIFYITAKDSGRTFESFDEIGFKHSQIPNPPSQVNNSASFSVKKIGSNAADSVARYLLKKM